MASNMPPPPPVPLGGWARRAAAKKPAAAEQPGVPDTPPPASIPPEFATRVINGEALSKEAMDRMTERVMVERRGLLPEAEMLPLATRLELERVLMERKMQAAEAAAKQKVHERAKAGAPPSHPPAPPLPVRTDSGLAKGSVAAMVKQIASKPPVVAGGDLSQRSPPDGVAVGGGGGGQRSGGGKASGGSGAGGKPSGSSGSSGDKMDVDDGDGGGNMMEVDAAADRDEDKPELNCCNCQAVLRPSEMLLRAGDDGADWCGRLWGTCYQCSPDFTGPTEGEQRTLEEEAAARNRFRRAAGRSWAKHAGSRKKRVERVRTVEWKNIVSYYQIAIPGVTLQAARELAISRMKFMATAFAASYALESEELQRKAADNCAIYVAQIKRAEEMPWRADLVLTRRMSADACGYLTKMTEHTSVSWLCRYKESEYQQLVAAARSSIRSSSSSSLSSYSSPCSSSSLSSYSSPCSRNSSLCSSNSSGVRLLWPQPRLDQARDA